MKITSTRDDVTGAELAESQEIKLTVGDASGTLDLGPDSIAALTALVNGEGSGLLAALLAPAGPAVRQRRGSASASRGGSRDGKPDPATGATPEEIRAWATSQGIAVNSRGRVPADVREKYRLAHSGSPAPAETPADRINAKFTPDGAQTDAPDTDAASTGKSARK